MVSFHAYMPNKTPFYVVKMASSAPAQGLGCLLLALVPQAIISARATWVTPALMLIGIASAALFFTAPLLPAIGFVASPNPLKNLPSYGYALLVLLCEETLARPVAHHILQKKLSQKLRLGAVDNAAIAFAIGVGHAACRLAQVSLPMLPIAFSGAVAFSGNDAQSGIPLAPAACMLGLLLSIALPAASLLGQRHWLLPSVAHVCLVIPPLAVAAATDSVGIGLAVLALMDIGPGAVLIATRCKARWAWTLLKLR
jgi:hypothetical protein